MAKITLNNLANLQNEETTIDRINSNSVAVATAMEKTLYRDGSTPNQMEAELDMDGNRIINLPTPLSNTEAVTKAYVDNLSGLAIELADIANNVLSIPKADTVAALKALNPVAFPMAYLTVEGKEGYFRWAAGNQSQNVTDDPLGGVYIPWDGDTDGSSGAYSRVYTGAVNPKWWGAVTSGSVDSWVAFQACSDFCSGRGYQIEIDPGDYQFTKPWVVWSGTNVRGKGTRLYTTLKWMGGKTKPTVKVRGPDPDHPELFDTNINALMVLAINYKGNDQGQGSSPGFGGQRVSGLSFAINTTQSSGDYAHDCDYALFIDATETEVSDCYFAGLPHKFDIALHAYQPIITTYDVSIHGNLYRSTDTAGTYLPPDNANLDEQTPAGIKIGSCQTVRIWDCFLQNCNRLLEIAPPTGHIVQPDVNITMCRFENAYNANDPTIKSIYIKSTLKTNITGCLFFGGPHSHPEANPAPHEYIFLDGSDPAEINYSTTIRDNWFGSVGTGELGTDNSPYFIKIGGTPDTIKHVLIDGNIFYGRPVPIAILGTRSVTNVEFGSNITNGSVFNKLVEFPDIDLVKAEFNAGGDRLLEENTVTPSLIASEFYLTNNTSPTTITGFANGLREGRTVRVFVDDVNTSITVSALGAVRNSNYSAYRSPGAAQGVIKLERGSYFDVTRGQGSYNVILGDAPASSRFSAYNANTLQIGNYKLWVRDNAGTPELYIKDISVSNPSSATDGTLLN